jgi:hypothetical protein
MPDFSPFDMNLDGDVDRVDFPGFDYLVRDVQGSDAEWHGGHGSNPLRARHRSDDEECTRERPCLAGRG